MLASGVGISRCKSFSRQNIVVIQLILRVTQPPSASKLFDPVYSAHSDNHRHDYHDPVHDALEENRRLGIVSHKEMTPPTPTDVRPSNLLGSSHPFNHHPGESSQVYAFGAASPSRQTAAPSGTGLAGHTLPNKAPVQPQGSRTGLALVLHDGKHG